MNTDLDPAALPDELRSRMTSLLGLLQAMHAATVELRLPVAGGQLADGYAILQNATGQYAAAHDPTIGATVGTFLAAAIRAVSTAGELRRRAWAWAAEDGADILHSGPRTRQAHALAAVLNHLQAAIESVGKGRK